MKKIFALMLVLSALGFVLVGCKSDEAAAPETTGTTAAAPTTAGETK